MHLAIAHSSCNQALGLLKDNPDLCRLAALYLEEDGKADSFILENAHETKEKQENEDSFS